MPILEADTGHPIWILQAWYCAEELRNARLGQTSTIICQALCFSLLEQLLRLSSQQTNEPGIAYFKEEAMEIQWPKQLTQGQTKAIYFKIHTTMESSKVGVMRPVFKDMEAPSGTIQETGQFPGVRMQKTVSVHCPLLPIGGR